MTHRCRVVTWVLLACLAVTVQASAQTELSRSEIREFLLTADVIASEETSSGITRPRRLTLSDGVLTHDALFQTVNQRRREKRIGNATELWFVDSYLYNVAAYELAELIGLGHMMPVTVERRIDGRRGSLSWWIDDVMFDEVARLAERAWPEDMARWSTQQIRMHVFAELVYDTDRNQTNQLYTRNWDLYMIDFSRAFRLWRELQRPEDLHRIDRQLFTHLRDLTRDEVEEALDPYLSGFEINGVLDRRDLLIEHFQRLIDERGADRVLY